MRKAFLSVFVMALAVALIAGCGKMSGTYRSNMDDEKDVAIVFETDGTFYSSYRGQKVKGGTYEKSGDSVTLKTESGDNLKASLDGDTLTIEYPYSGTKTYTKQ